MANHLYQYGQDRERQTIRRLFVDGAPGVLAQMLGIPGWHWLGICLPSHRLGRERGDQPGDVDICGGPLVCDSALEWRAAQAEAVSRLPRVSVRPGADAEGPFRYGHVQRAHKTIVDDIAARSLLARRQLRPSLDQVFAFEVKVSWFRTDGVLKAGKTGRNLQKEARDQARGLAEMGFDNVGLLRILVTEPCPNPEGSAWMHAGSHASQGAREYEDAITAKDNDPFATIVASVGAVMERQENHAGSLSVGIPIVGQWANPFVKAEPGAAARMTFQDALGTVLEDAEGPRRLPMLVLACADDGCGRLFVPGSDEEVPWEAHCPDCDGPTTATRE